MDKNWKKDMQDCWSRNIGDVASQNDTNDKIELKIQWTGGEILWTVNKARNMISMNKTFDPIGWSEKEMSRLRKCVRAFELRDVKLK